MLVMFSSGEERTDCDAGEGAFDVIFLMSLNMWSVLLEVKERGREEVTSGSGGKLCGVVAGAKAVDDRHLFLLHQIFLDPHNNSNSIITHHTQIKYTLDCFSMS